jgi:DNA topoisomerase-1
LHGVAYYAVKKDGEEIVIAPAVGHLLSLKQKTKGYAYPVFDISWEAVDKGFTKKYLAAMKSLIQKADSLVSACDWDIEGSLIAGNLIRAFGKGKKAERMYFSTLTKEELLDALSNLSPLDEQDIEAGEARHKLDWFWGINSSRALMQAIKKAGTFRVMSIGRVQGPSLALLAEREKEILAFKPRPFWQVLAVVKEAEFAHDSNNFFEKPAADKAFENASKSGKAKITSVERKKVKQMPPFPFDLTSLQMEAYRSFGFNPSQTLEIAQKLYEQALISYPRTSSQKLPAKLGLQKIISKISENPEYSKLAKELLEKKLLSPHEGPNEDKAHPAIYPTGLQGVLKTAYEKKIFDLVTKRFLACFAPPALRERMQVKASIGGEPFSVSGARTVSEGWLAFYSPYAKMEETLLPDFVEGQEYAAKVSIREGETQPPKRFTQASLVKKLEQVNLGTKATRAEVVKTLVERDYASGKQLQVTPLGMAVFDALKENTPEVMSEELTRQLEEEINGIQEGKQTQKKVLEDGKKELVKILEEFREREGKIGTSLLSALRHQQKLESELGPCKCGGLLTIKRSRFGFFVGCSKYPDCRVVFPLPRNAKIIPLGKQCEKCNTPTIRVIRSGRKTFEMCLDPKCESKKDWGKKWRDKKKDEATGEEGKQGKQDNDESENTPS